MTFWLSGLLLHQSELHPKASQLSGVDRLVLSVLFGFAADDKKPVAFVSSAKLAHRCGIARSTVQVSLEHMEDIGVIAGVHKDRRPTRWTPDPSLLERTSPGAGPGTTSPRGGATSPGAGQAMTESRSRHDREPGHASPGAGHQGTEVSYGTKFRNERTDLTGDAASGVGSTSFADASAASPGETGDDVSALDLTAEQIASMFGGIPPGVSAGVVSGPVARSEDS